MYIHIYNYIVLVKIENYKYSGNLGYYFNILQIFEEKKNVFVYKFKIYSIELTRKNVVALSKIDKEIEKGSERLKR